jgi:RND family efflux transporter MFP subunit
MSHAKSNLRKALALIVAAGAVYAAGCGETATGQSGAPTSRPVEAVKVGSAKVQFGSIPETIELIGSLYGDEDSSISAKVPGRILELSADLGDRVEPGTLLARIDPTDYKLAIAQKELAVREALSRLGLTEMPDAAFDPTNVPTVLRATLQADNAKARLDRSRKLFEQSPPLLSAQDFADIQTQYEVARKDADVAKLEAEAALALARSREAELTTSRQQLSDTEIRTPATKTWSVSRRDVAIGEYVQTGAPLFQLVVVDPIRMRATIPEKFSPRVKLDQRVEVRIEGLDAPRPGKVRRISPAVDPQSRTFAVEVELANADQALRPGAFARGTLVVGTQEKVAMVPDDAVRSFAGIDRVFTVENGKAKALTVTVLRREEGMVAIAPTPPGDVVLRGNLGPVAEGVSVRIDESATKPTTRASR